MKKHLIAAAVAAAVAVPAMAQVTLSGNADFALQDRDNGLTSATSGQSGTLSTPGLTFSATEDLGAGLKASFTARAEFSMATGTYEVADGLDQVFMSLSGGFGAITVGKHGFAARNANGAGAHIGNVGLVGSVTGVAQRALGDERAGAVSYVTPSFSGLSAAVSIAPRSTERAAGVVGNTSIGTGETTGILLQYAQGPLTVAFSKLEADVDATNDQETENVAANYNLGFARVGVIRLENTPTTGTPGVKNVVTVLNASVPFGATSLIGAYHSYAGKVAAGANPDAKSFVVGVVHTLSKRTNVYAVYADTDNNATGTYSISSQATAAAGRDQSTLSLGMRHSF